MSTIEDCLSDPDPSRGLSQLIAMRSRLDSSTTSEDDLRAIDDAIDLLDVRAGATKPTPLTMGWVIARCHRLALRSARECRSLYSYKFLRPRELEVLLSSTTDETYRKSLRWDGSAAQLRELSNKCQGDTITITSGHDGSDDRAFGEYDPLIDCDWWITFTAEELRR
jgi:hypothetical protein